MNQAGLTYLPPLRLLCHDSHPPVVITDKRSTSCNQHNRKIKNFSYLSPVNRWDHIIRILFVIGKLCWWWTRATLVDHRRGVWEDHYFGPINLFFPPQPTAPWLLWHIRLRRGLCTLFIRRTAPAVPPKDAYVAIFRQG